jgi:arylsulfatase A-like enzyme
MRSFCQSFFCLIVAAGCLQTSGARAQTKPPNILFIFGDDHAYQAIGAYGHGLNKTPNIDRLAPEGMRFDRCLTTNSLCGPSRAWLLTGKYSHMNHFYDNTNSRFEGSQVTFPKLLQKAGYQTAIIGKWHLEADPTGFDFWEILSCRPQEYLYICAYKREHWRKSIQHGRLANLQRSSRSGDDWRPGTR